MFCTNCGNKVNDDAVFCTNCGFKLYKEEKEAQIPEASPVIRPNFQVGGNDNTAKEVANQAKLPSQKEEEEVVPVNIMVQPVPDTMPVNEIPKKTDEINGSSTAYVPYGNQQYVQMQNFAQEVKVRKNIIAFSVLSVIFSLLTIAASVFEMLDDVSEIQDIARLIEVCITSIILIIYAFSNNRTVSVLKGIAVAVTMAADIIFVGYSSVKYCINSLTGNNAIRVLSLASGEKEWVITAFFISMLAWFGEMYIFFIIEAIRGFAGARGAKTITLFFGFVAAAALIANIVFRSIIEGMTLYYDVVPMNLGYVFLILTMCFGIIGKKRLKKQSLT